MSRSLIRLTSSLMNTPLLATPECAEGVFEYLTHRNSTDMAVQLKKPQEGDTGLRVTDGVAHIQILGPLSHRASGIDALCGAVSYASLRRNFDEAMSREDVNKILFEIDSGGGEAAGTFDLSRHIAKSRGKGKEIIAYVSENAYSAAYAIACAADKVFLPDTGGVGSIGVITVHQDVSAALEKQGVKVTPIYAGDFKALGNPYEPLGEEAKGIIQSRVDSLYTKFVQLVADNRGITAEAVRDTQARTYLAEDAIRIGLADAVMSTEELNEYLYGEPSSQQVVTPYGMEAAAQTEEEIQMNEELQQQLEAQAAEMAEMKAKLDAYAAAETQAKVSALKERASAWSVFGVDAEAYAEAAMSGNVSVEMFDAAMSQATEKLTEMQASHEEALAAVKAEAEAETQEAAKQAKVAIDESEAMKELGSDGEGEEAPVNSMSGVEAAIQAMLQSGKIPQ